MQTPAVTGKILVVDDNASNVKILEERLEAYTLRTARSGEEALGIAPDFAPDLVLLDIMMPGIDGYEVCRRLRALPGMEHTKIIMVTAKALRNERLEGYAAGADDYMVKPFDGQELLAKVRVYLRLKSTEEFNRQLARDVEARTRDYRLAKEAAEQANMAKNRFISVMTHELRNPLSAIIGYAGLLLETLPRGEYDEALEGIQAIMDSGTHLGSLVSDIFDVVKIERDVVHLHKTSFPAVPFAETAADMVRPRIEAAALALTLHVDPAVSNVTGDRKRCLQILTNLLTNAIKYTGHGGRVDVHITREAADEVRIAVADTGVGIAPEHQTRLFTEFYQVDRERDEALGGTGMGLALVHRLVKLHDGRVGVDSKQGEGSTFWFTLPVVEAPEHTEPPPLADMAALPQACAGRHVLVVEDNPVNQALMLDMLGRHDIRVTIAKDGEEGLELARYHRPDLVLMDLNMPVMDGYAATQALRALPEFADTPIIALSASTGPRVVERCLAAGCNRHLAKPIQWCHLEGVLKEYLAV